AENNPFGIQHRFKAGYFYPKLFRPHCYDNARYNDTEHVAIMETSQPQANIACGWLVWGSVFYSCRRRSTTEKRWAARQLSTGMRTPRAPNRGSTTAMGQ